MHEAEVLRAGGPVVTKLCVSCAEARVKAGEMPISSKLVQELRDMVAVGPRTTLCSGVARLVAASSAVGQPQAVSGGGPSRMMQVPVEELVSEPNTVPPQPLFDCNPPHNCGHQPPTFFSMAAMITQQAFLPGYKAPDDICSPQLKPAYAAWCIQEVALPADLPEEPSLASMGISTRILHPVKSQIDPYSASCPPLYQTATFGQPSAVEGGPYDYTRSGNPTRTALEEQMAALEARALVNRIYGNRTCYPMFIPSLALFVIIRNCTTLMSDSCE